jgi:flagella synthesis protein FlgN
MHSFGTSPADSLDEEIKATHQLLQVLKLEQAQLVEANIDGLTALTEEKAKIVAKMSELARGRHSALAAAGCAAAEEGMQAWLNSPAASVAAGKSWKELLTLAQVGKDLNRTNGLLIARHMTRNQTALNVLQGGTQGGALYGRDGQTTNQPGGRRLIVG